MPRKTTPDAKASKPLSAAHKKRVNDALKHLARLTWHAPKRGPGTPRPTDLRSTINERLNREQLDDHFTAAWKADPPKTSADVHELAITAFAEAVTQAPGNLKDLVARVIRRWATPPGAEPRQFDENTKLKSLNSEMDYLRKGIEVAFENTAGFEATLFMAAWNKAPPKTVDDLYKVVAKSFQS